MELCHLGKTIMFPMRPAQFIHQLQRQPLTIFVLSSAGLVSSGQVEMSGLSEAVIRASKGLTYPICSVERFKLITNGDFKAKVVGSIRVIAIGSQNVSTVRSSPRRNSYLAIDTVPSFNVEHSEKVGRQITEYTPRENMSYRGSEPKMLFNTPNRN